SSTGLHLNDTLPPGFAYVPGSLRLNDLSSSDPSGGVGPTLDMDFPQWELAPNASVSVQYRVRVGVGAIANADAINRAYAASQGTKSPEAIARVRVSGGAFSDDAYAFGKVHLDCNRNGVQDGPDEWGIPGVRLILENGVSVTTDVQGRWSLFGLKPQTHVIRLDRSTLPVDAELVAWDHRNMGSADSRFLDIRNGEFAKANFLVANCDSAAVTGEIEERRQALQGKPDAELDALAKTRLVVGAAASSPVTTSGVQRNTTASGGVGAMDMVQGVAGANSQPLIKLNGALLAAVAPMNNGQPGGAVPQVGALPATREGGADLLGPLAAPDVVALEDQLEDADNRLAFIGLKDGDTLSSNVVNVRVKGHLETRLELRVNGQQVATDRVGKKAVVEDAQLAAWEYIGVEMQNGVNTLQLVSVDPMGNERGSQSISVIAPAEPALIHIDLPADPRADPRRPLDITIRITEKQGVPVTWRSFLTLETDLGIWLSPDLNPNVPGTQVAIEGGHGHFLLQPP
ncbi:MAG: hypothetical protein ACR2I0_14205, partial [Rhodoferax sp.]